MGEVKKIMYMSKAECINMQNALKRYINKTDTFSIDDIKTIAGVDIAYWKEDTTEKAVCCIVVIDINTLEVLESQHTYGEVNFPYIPGCLAFREIPLVIETAQKLRTSADIYMMDGNGVLHPRQMGLATQASFYLNKPTIGVAKTYYKINDTDFDMPKDEVGAATDIKLDGQVVGKVLRTHRKVKPVFVSIGNNISIDTSVDLVMKVVGKESHIPVPTRLADIDTHKWRSKYKL